MNTRHAAVLALIFLGTAIAPRMAVAVIDESASNRQILVMLRSVPPHFRPDLSYSGSYDARAGRDARRRTAEALAAIQRLAGDPLLRARIGDAARVHAIELVERQRDASRAFYLGDGACRSVATRRDGAVAGGISPVEIG